jgi:hypothetical protein
MQTEQQIDIDTGSGKWTVSRVPADTVRGLFGADDLWYQTGDGKRYAFKLDGPDAGVSLEEAGPNVATVRAVGWYFADAGQPPIARGELRAQFYRGQPFYRLYHTLTYMGNPWKDTLGSMGIRFKFTDKATAGAVELDGKAVELAKPSSLMQVNEDLAQIIGPDGKITITGRRAAGAVSLTTNTGAAVIYHRNLWQMFPKKIDVDPAQGAVSVHYWPQEAGPMKWTPREDGWLPSSSSMPELAVGTSRTHEFVIDPAGTMDVTRYEAAFDEPVLAAVPPRHLTQTQAMLHLQPYDPAVVPELERQIRTALESYAINQQVYGWYGQWVYGAIPNTWVDAQTRWADYGRYAHILNEQDIVHAPWVAYLRSGDRRIFRLAEANTRHLMEVATIRMNPVWPEHAGMSRRHHECIWLGSGDYGHSMLDPFMELYHVTGYRPAWEACERMARGMAEQREGSWRYISNPLAGLARMHLETQDPFYKQHADRIWEDLCNPDRNTWYVMDHGNRAILYYHQLNEKVTDLWKQWADVKPEWVDGLDLMALLHEKTGDIRYAQAAAKGLSGAKMQSPDPMRWQIGTITQYVLAHLREQCYASKAIAAAQAAAPADAEKKK